MGSMVKVNMKNTAIVYSIILLLICAATTGHVVLAFKETATSRQDGYNKGYNDAICDLKSCHGHGLDPSCPSGHTDTFCSGYADGYATAQSNNNNNNLSPRNTGSQSNRGDIGFRGNANQGTNNQPIGGQTSSEQESSGVTTIGDTPWKEFGVFLGPIQRHTGVYHNENGVFLPWTTVCNKSQSYLLQSCDSLIGPDGKLTSAGDKALGCITNGVIVTAIAAKLNIQFSTIENILNAVAKPTGCDGIVNMDQIQSSPTIQLLAGYVGKMAG